MLGDVAHAHLVAGAQLARGERSAAGERLDQRRLARAVGAHQRDVLAALDPDVGFLEQHAPRHLDPAAFELEHHPSRALRVGERERQRAPVARLALDALHLLQPLHARLRLACLACLGAEALHEPLEACDLGLLALDRPAQRDLTRGLLLAPRVPRAGEESRPARLQLQHRGADRLEEPAVVRHQHDRRVEPLQMLLEPLERGDVEVVGRLVEQQQVRLAGQRAGQRAPRELSTGEGRKRAVEVGLHEPEAAQGDQRAITPAVAAVVLEALLSGAIGAERCVVARAAGHLVLEPLELALDSHHLRRAREHVVAQGQAALARRTLIVQRDLRPLLQARAARGRPWRRRPASAAAWSCPSRCGRTASSGRAARA